MADLRSILTDPNYTEANDATKRAIFERYAQQDPNYVNANEATKQAIRAKYGVAEMPAEEAAAAAPAAPPPAPEEPETTFEGLTGAAVRGLAPVAAGTALGAALGAPTVVGAIPGAVAGAGIGTAMQLVGDPLVSGVNSLLGTQYTLPTDALADMLTRLGVSEPRTEAERIVQVAASGGGAAGGTVAAGRAMQRFAAGQTAQGVGRTLAMQPGLQVGGGVLAGGAGQGAAEAGGGPLEQAGASIAAAMAPYGAAAAMRRPTIPLRIDPEVTPPPGGEPPPPPPEPPPPGIAEAAADVSEAAVTDVLNLARRAAGVGPGSAAARAKLADLAQVNVDARDAAQRLGIELPFDVFSDNPQVRSAVGLTRALVGSEAESAWESTVRSAIGRADEISQQFDATFIEGRPAPGATSQNILDNLKGTQAQLAKDASDIYNEVNAVVPKTSAVQFPKLTQTLDDILAEVGERGFTAQERRLSELAKDPDATYGRLIREKALIGQAIEGKDSPYGNMAAADLKRLYAALADDQLTNVGRIGGEELRRQLRGANLLTAKKKALEKRIVAAFGKEIDGSVGQRMQTAITTAAKGDAAAFNRLMKVVPKDLQRETIATALASVTAGKAAGRGAAGAAETVFSPSEYTKVYRGLRANPPVYSKMVEIMGPEWEKASRDLYTVSRRIADAQARIPQTGKANQILGEAAIQGLMGRMMTSGIGQRAVTGVVGSLPGGGVIAPDIVNWMTASKGSGVQKASRVFASPEFQELAVQAATRAGNPSAAALRRVAMSNPFNEFAESAGLPKPIDARVQWLQSAIQAGIQNQQEPE